MKTTHASLLSFALLATPAFAERPMTVDDAGTMSNGGAKVEFGWSRDHKARGWDALAGYSPMDDVEIELSLNRLRDHDPDPTAKLRGTAFGFKWVPLQNETGLSAGVKLGVGRTRITDRINPSDTEHARYVNGLLMWKTESGQKILGNLGHEWVNARGPDSSVNTWGLGFDQPLVDKVNLTIEAFGANKSGPDKQLGLRWEVAEGVKLSVGAGRGNDRSFGNAGLAWEF